MTTAKDVPADRLIKVTTERLKENEAITQPDWSKFVKTGVHREKPPVQKDWWYIRAAAVLRTIYTKGPIGVSRLRGKYGGNKNRGSFPNQARKGGGKIIRVCLQQLEAAELIKKDGNKGRVVTPQGQSFLNNIAHEVLRELVKDDPNLGKF